MKPPKNPLVLTRNEENSLSATILLLQTLTISAQHSSLLCSRNNPRFHLPQMGCGASRMDSGEEIPSGLMAFRLRIHDLKLSRTDDSRRRHRERKDSIVSTTELLRPEERDVDEYEAPAAEGFRDKEEHEGNGSNASDSSAVTRGQAEHGDDEGRRIGFGREQRAADAAVPELPGSPSFRFYFTDAVHGIDDDGRAGSNHSVKEVALEPIEEKEPVEREADNDCIVPAEGSDLKASRKEKGRKFMVLPKAGFLNVRGCYNPNSSSHNIQESAQILSEKTA